jgi:nucleotide-binding universal stress UspA family protein
MQTMLVPLDGSALAERILPYVQLLAPLLSARVLLLRVISEGDKQGILAHEDVRLAPERGPAPALPAREWHAWQQLRTQAESYVAARVAQLRAAGLAAEGEVCAGTPAESILGVAAQRQISLIALATHGYGGVTRWALGSVADKVVHAATVPVLVVRGTAEAAHREAIKRLLVPLDGSDLARQALPIAIELAQRTQAEMILLQAIPPVVEAYPYTPLPMSIRIPLHEQAHKELGALADQLRRQGIPTTPLVVEGYAAEVIVDLAEQRSVDLIVMATHGYTGIKRWALGSVASKVLRAAPTPLLLVRASSPPH